MLKELPTLRRMIVLLKVTVASWMKLPTVHREIDEPYYSGGMGSSCSVMNKSDKLPTLWSSKSIEPMNSRFLPPASCNKPTYKPPLCSPLPSLTIKGESLT